ncbi:MAG TPA: hypothetical protein VID47_02760 [Actinomycetota bacterium]
MRRTLHPFGDRRRPARIGAGIAVAAAAVAVMASPASAGTAGLAAKPGPTRAPIVLQDHIEMFGVDLASDSAGTAYLGWISSANGTSDARTVHLCVLPKGASACAGGIMSTDSLDHAGARDIRVLATSTGHVTLLWFHDTAGSVNGPNGGRVATATYQRGGTLSDGTDRFDAPSFGDLFAAANGPGGTIWTLTWSTVNDGRELQVHPGFTAPAHNLTTPYRVIHGWLAFAGSRAVIAVDKDGAIGEPVAYTSGTTSFPAFKKVLHTWNLGGAVGMVGTRSGVRLAAGTDNASYQPVISKFAGTSFGPPHLDGDTNPCAPSSHDLVTDASGRVADASAECSQVAVANLANTTNAAIVRFNTGGTPAGTTPQIATTPRGIAWVAWGIESNTADKLKVVPVLLPGLETSVTHSGPGGTVTVTGPAKCLPAVQAPVKVTAHPAQGFHLAGTTLKLAGTNVHGTINGASIPPGASRKLVGTATFTRSGQPAKRVWPR